MNATGDRYSRQLRLAELGSEGQERLLESSVLIVGCGALGSHLANTLTRAGVGRIRIVDRDYLELNNLQRQVLFDEEDVAARLPKAEAVARKLSKINSGIEIEGRVVDVTARNIESLLADRSLVLDGTDNFETRYLINDACIKHARPWIYAGVIGTTGMTMNILPPEGPCLRCLLPTPPPVGSLPTCETQGVLGTAPALIASLQATEAIKLLVGKETSRHLVCFDLWNQSCQRLKLVRSKNCPTCVQKQFDFLEAQETAWVTTLCGRNAVQITPPRETSLRLDALSETLASLGQVSYNGYLLQLVIEGYEMILFPDGRVIVKGTTQESVARGLYARYVGT